MACNDCEETLSLDQTELVLWRGTRVGVRACSMHTAQIRQVFDLMNDMYDTAYEEAVREMTANLLALRGGEREP